MADPPTIVLELERILAKRGNAQSFYFFSDEVIHAVARLTNEERKVRILRGSRYQETVLRKQLVLHMPAEVYGTHAQFATALGTMLNDAFSIALLDDEAPFEFQARLGSIGVGAWNPYEEISSFIAGPLGDIWIELQAAARREPRPAPPDVSSTKGSKEESILVQRLRLFIEMEETKPSKIPDIGPPSLSTISDGIALSKMPPHIRDATTLRAAKTANGSTANFLNLILEAEIMSVGSFPAFLPKDILVPQAWALLEEPFGVEIYDGLGRAGLRVYILETLLEWVTVKGIASVKHLDALVEAILSPRPLTLTLCRWGVYRPSDDGAQGLESGYPAKVLGAFFGLVQRSAASSKTMASAVEDYFGLLMRVLFKAYCEMVKEGLIQTPVSPSAVVSAPVLGRDSLSVKSSVEAGGSKLVPAPPPKFSKRDALVVVGKRTPDRKDSRVGRRVVSAPPAKNPKSASTSAALPPLAAPEVSVNSALATSPKPAAPSSLESAVQTGPKCAPAGRQVLVPLHSPSVSESLAAATASPPPASKGETGVSTSVSSRKSLPRDTQVLRRQGK
ncbi:hypothetical protein C8R43DRAFT_1111619 [Mycena crocata]|nr:hypothetical protein C8R43DRAFT_1111619 [Mycena crocata]